MTGTPLEEQFIDPGNQRLRNVPHEKRPSAEHRGTRVAGIDRLPDHYLRQFGVVS